MNRSIQGNRNRIPGMDDAQNWTFYDVQAYAAGGVSQLSFFQTPRGQGGRTLEDTNFPGAGALPAGMAFILQEVQFCLFPGSQLSSLGAPALDGFTRDVYAIGQRGIVELQYHSKNLIEDGPLGRFPPDFALSGFAAMSSATTLGANLDARVAYAQWSGRPYRVADVLIESQVNLEVKVSFPNGLANMPSGNAARLGCYMRGVLKRNAQ